ncbi:hypothetical protein QIG72_25970, partial [Klebsiella pneumoniae]|nr:hypothetical protein [Klebsiella pneumoniae]
DRLFLLGREITHRHLVEPDQEGMIEVGEILGRLGGIAEGRQDAIDHGRFRIGAKARERHHRQIG